MNEIRIITRSGVVYTFRGYTRAEWSNGNLKIYFKKHPVKTFKAGEIWEVKENEIPGTN